MCCWVMNFFNIYLFFTSSLFSSSSNEDGHIVFFCQTQFPISDLKPNHTVAKANAILYKNDDFICMMCLINYM